MNVKVPVPSNRSVRIAWAVVGLIIIVLLVLLVIRLVALTGDYSALVDRADKAADARQALREANARQDAALEEANKRLVKAGKKPVIPPNITINNGQEPEIQEPEHQDPEKQNPERQDPERQEREIQEPEIQNPEINDPEVQDPEIQDPEVNDPDPASPFRFTFIVSGQNPAEPSYQYTVSCTNAGTDAEPQYECSVSREEVSDDQQQ